MKRIFLAAAIVMSTGCAGVDMANLKLPDMSMLEERSMRGTWKGNMACEKTGLGNQDMTLRFREGQSNSSFYGTIENNIVYRGRPGWMRYVVQGTSSMGQITIKPTQILERRGNFKALDLTATRRGDDQMVTNFCDRNVVFTRISSDDPVKKPQQ